MYADSYPPSITLAFPAWFSAQAAPFPLDPAVQVAASGAVSPVFSASASSSRRHLLAASSSLGVPLGVLLDSSSAGLSISAPGSFNGSTSVSGGALLAAFGSRLPFSLLPCAAGQSPTGFASGCGVSAQDSSGADLSGVLVALQLLPDMMLSMPLDSLAFACDAQSAMEGQCLPGVYVWLPKYEHVWILKRGLRRQWKASACQLCGGVWGFSSTVRCV